MNKRQFPSVKKQHTEPPPCEFRALKGRRALVEQELEVVASAPRKFEGSELGTGWECYEITEDEMGTYWVPSGSHVRIPLKVEGTIEGWRSLDIKVRIVAAMHGVGVEFVAANL